MTSIDLNADLGEAFGSLRMRNDAAMLSIVSSANIACGFHAGDPLQMSEVVECAKDNEVSIGAHPGFNDKRFFGRRRLNDLPDEQLTADLIYQIGALQAIARSKGQPLSYVKLHGALANMACEDFKLAQTCIEAIRNVDNTLGIMVMPRTAMEKAAKAADCPIICEIYADRAYSDEALLVSRHEPGGVIENPQLAADRMIAFVETGVIKSVSGKPIEITAQSICVHGDNPHAIRMAEMIRDRLESSGVQIESPTLNRS